MIGAIDRSMMRMTNRQLIELLSSIADADAPGAVAADQFIAIVAVIGVADAIDPKPID